jgi:hypothetical protein
VGLGSQLGATAWATKYSREFESQADILGAQMLARAGYDPREMANMFKTIEAQGGGGGLEWFSSHPNPGNRYVAITTEAESLQVQGRADTSEFTPIQARLRDAGPSYTAEQIAKGQATARNAPASTARRPAVTIDPPSIQTRTLSPSTFFRVTVPANWVQISGDNGATYAPRGGYVQSAGRTAFTHGVQFGVVQGSGNLQRDAQSLIDGFARSNPNLRQRTGLRRDSIGGRQAYTTTLTNVSDVTGQPELITLSTTTLADGRVFFMIGVAPESESSTYGAALQRVKQSIRLSAR